ncbi:FAD binding domain-containing protein [Mycolicibacterium boenickei]|nr:FAD binding domain-containing protein [Mycolicibacterium boenickei]
MDLNTVEMVSTPTHRDELWPLGPADAILAGGTWLFSEPQIRVRRLVDITSLGWEPVCVEDSGITLAATCSLAQISRLSTELRPTHPEWTAAGLLHQCCTALLASFKVLGTATIGGNICLSFPAGAMISLLSALDGTVTVWRPDGTEYTLPVTEFVTGQATNALTPGEVLRSVHLPAASLRARTAMRKIALSPLGRSGVVVIGRRDNAFDGGGVLLSVTAATVRPYVFGFADVPSAGELATALATIPADAWTRDSHGDPDWRRAVTGIVADEVRGALTREPR